MSEIFADRICELCASDFTVFTNLREDLISKQKTLYQLAGLEESCFYFDSTVQAVEDGADMVEEQSDFDMNFETMDTDEVANVFIEEEIDARSLASESYVDEDAAAAELIFKVEKVDDKTEPEEDEPTSFDFFEEIVGSESGDQKYSQSESSNEKFVM